MKLSEAKKVYLEAKESYYRGSPTMSDATFDRLENWIKKKDPNWKPLRETGTKVGKKVEVKLPYFMPSLDKRYQNIDEWFTKHPRYRWAYMAKLDGSSVLLEYVDGRPTRLITRGDGEYGKDISYFLPYLNIPKKIKHKGSIAFRCEAIISKEDYHSKWATAFDNPRNMVSGIFNRQDLHPALKDIHLVVLGVFGLPQYKGLCAAFRAGFETVYCKLDSPREQAKHFEYIRAGKYEADGVVICNPDWVYLYESSEKPKTDIIAYKENVEFKDTTVQEVIYQVSVNGRLIPKIKVEPVVLAGANISYCTAHNAKWMIDHGIGVGAKVRITRSGDVIPKIIDVIEKAEVTLPTISYRLKGVHFVADDRTEEQKVKAIARFIAFLGVESVKGKTVEVLYKNLKITSVHRLLLAIHHPRFLTRLQELFGTKKGKIIYDALHPLITTRFPIARLMIASGAFDAGVGYKRLTLLQEQDFDLLALSSWTEPSIKESIICPGIGDVTAGLIANGLTSFQKFWSRNKNLMGEPLPYIKHEVKKSGPLEGLNITFTGYRSSEQEKLLISLGANIISFSRKTDVLLYTETGRKSSKVEKAGEKAMTFSQFKTKYHI